MQQSVHHQQPVSTIQFYKITSVHVVTDSSVMAYSSYIEQCFNCNIYYFLFSFSCAETLAGPKEQFLIVNQGQTILKVPLTASGSITNDNHRILYVPRKRFTD